MLILFNISDTAAKHFGDTPEAIGQNLLLKAALEDYREGRISEGRFAEILGISRWEGQEILDQHHARRPYTLEMLEEDRRSLAKVFGGGVSVVVVDTTPVNYLVLCEAIDVLRPIYGQVVIPSAVFQETHSRPDATQRLELGESLA